MTKRSLRVLLLVLCTLLLCACQRLTERQVANAIDASFDAGLCWKLEDMQGVRFPLRTRYDPANRQGLAILEGLSRQGLIRVQFGEVSASPYGFFPQKVVAIALTPAGEQARVWDPMRGFCVGRKRVMQVIRFSEPTGQPGFQITQAEFTWAVQDVPAWLDRSAFADLPGMLQPKTDTIFLRKMSDGWSVFEG